jgi:hypothetical protein
LLPKWIEKKSFEIFLKLLKINSPSNNSANKIDLNTCKKLIDISIFFKAFHIAENLISDSILPNLEKQTCLKIIKEYIHLIYEEDTRGIFVDLIHKCIEISSKNIFYLINNQQDELFSLTEDSLEEIIERYFESVLYNTNIDHSLIMRLMMKNRKLNDIFDLLENERRRSIDIFERMYQEGLEPTIIWKIQSNEPRSGYYKDSEEFVFENVKIILINYYDAEKDTYSIALKLTEIKDSNNNKLESEMSHFIISILSICEIKEINYKSKINFNCIFSNTRTKVLVCKIENFSQLFLNSGFDFDESINYSITMYFNLSYNFSSIITHICKNFYEYHSLNSIGRVPKNVLNIILKNETLNVRNEDEVLYSVMNWGNIIYIIYIIYLI